MLCSSYYLPGEGISAVLELCCLSGVLMVSSSSAWKNSIKKNLHAAIYSYFTFFALKLHPVLPIMTALFPSKAREALPSTILAVSDETLHFLGTFNHQALWRSQPVPLM